MQTENATVSAACTMTIHSIDGYIQHERERGVCPDSVRHFSHVARSLFDWLPEDKEITKERLLAWRQSLKDHGYTQQTELNYVKGINRYLDYLGFPQIRFNRGKPKDIAGMQFGYLTALAPTGQKQRKDHIWRCVCRCGKKAEYPATRLLLGNTVSCGCLRGEHFKRINKYIGGTSLRQSIEEQVESTRAMSGYTGVTTKRGKWRAYIRYKGQTIDLGCYTRLEDAVKARAKGKEAVQLDAMDLLDFYETLHKDDPALPDRAKVREENKPVKQDPPTAPASRAVRSNNTSGQPGVSRKRDKWAAKITFEKITYQLGSYDSIEDAIAVRKAAEQMLQENPGSFPDWVLSRRRSGKQEKKCAKR